MQISTPTRRFWAGPGRWGSGFADPRLRFSVNFYGAPALSFDEFHRYRQGLTVALPVNQRNSLKLYASTGVSSRTDDDYDGLGMAWQYRFGRNLPW